jgi:hypothetical protein
MAPERLVGPACEYGLSTGRQTGKASSILAA